ncbi:ATP-binding protein [Dyadobacter sp. CY343]|uniref:ATP-binding protein n=1 Tax=Dyadobacter sp. CY343 TaxID=2907299 RepID=UPI001F2E3BD5|nr:ATP-binding protein [Dyadobacter sp. CY343]MCE7061254.1 ATP-binding protein [Dyadobacter sp. CY343]
MNLTIIQDNDILRAQSEIYLPDFVLLTGENGSGKTQLLNALHGMELATITSDDGQALTHVHHAGQGFAVELNDSAYREALDEIKQRWDKVMPIMILIEAYLFKDSLTSEDVEGLNTRYHRLLYREPENGGRYSRTYVSYQEAVQAFNLCKTSLKHAVEFTETDFFIFAPLSTYHLFYWSIPLVFKQFALKKKHYPSLVDDVEAPWDLFNRISSRSGFSYKIVYQPSEDHEPPSAVKFVHEKGFSVDITKLSSGERSLLSLVLTLYNTGASVQPPELLLLDEPDAYLHPSLADKFLTALYDVLVKEKSIKVIMTTHSPSTVALAPPESGIFIMHKDVGYPVECGRNEAIRALTKGLTTLNVSIENRKQVFTEAETDQYFYEKLFEKLVVKDELKSDQLLLFVSVGGTDNSISTTKAIEDAGCAKVKTLTKQLYNDGNGNRQIFGIIDWDTRNNGSDRILVFANKTRYCLENFVYDPLFIACFALTDGKEKHNYGLEAAEDIFDIHRFDSPRLQSIIDTITMKVFSNMIWSDDSIKSTDLSSVSLLNGKQVYLPVWYLKNPGHKIEAACRAAFNPLGAERKTAVFIAKYVIPNYQFLPIDVKNTFEMLQGKSTLV